MNRAFHGFRITPLGVFAFVVMSLQCPPLFAQEVSPACDLTGNSSQVGPHASCFGLNPAEVTALRVMVQTGRYDELGSISTALLGAAGEKMSAAWSGVIAPPDIRCGIAAAIDTIRTESTFDQGAKNTETYVTTQQVALRAGGSGSDEGPSVSEDGGTVNFGVDNLKGSNSSGTAAADSLNSVVPNIKEMVNAIKKASVYWYLSHPPNTVVNVSEFGNKLDKLVFAFNGSGISNCDKYATHSTRVTGAEFYIEEHTFQRIIEFRDLHLPLQRPAAKSDCGKPNYTRDATGRCVFDPKEI